MKINYAKFKEFENLFLEDSFVLEINEKPNAIKFSMELVLTSEHYLYSKPKPDEQYCYKNAVILFSEVSECQWIEKNLIPLTDNAGEIDYGNIDELYFENGFYFIWGDFGQLIIQSKEPRIEYNQEI